MVVHCPAEVAFQTDERAIHRSGLLSLNCLEIGAIAGEYWRGDGVRVKTAGILNITCRLGCSCLEPCDEVADIAEVIADRSRCQVLLFAHGLLILCQCSLPRRGELRVRLSLHAYLIRVQRP